ncbi:hypothetical protein GCM10027346_08300 [Hymenobacter seoulensis]
MRTQSTIRPSVALQLHEVPAGRRLDFDTPRGLFAYLYRRYGQQPWQCIARNACSPHIDHTPLPSYTIPEYVVCYCDAAGDIKAATRIASAAFSEVPGRSALT